jgi:hypothetical protein
MYHQHGQHWEGGFLKKPGNASYGQTVLITIVAKPVFKKSWTPKSFAKFLNLFSKICQLLQQQQCSGVQIRLGLTYIRNSDFSRLTAAAGMSLRNFSFMI